MIPQWAKYCFTFGIWGLILTPLPHSWIANVGIVLFAMLLFMLTYAFIVYPLCIKLEDWFGD